MREGYWAIRTIKAGLVGEKIKYFVPGKKPTRSDRKLKAEIRKQEQNDKNAVRRLARALNENYRAGRDILLTLDYAIAPESRKEAEHILRLWLERVRRSCKKKGVLLRYVAVSSDMDAKTGEIVRWHHHVVINAEAAELAKEKWTAGGTNREKLYGKDLTPLAEYLLVQVRREVPNEKKYIPSRNMKQPQITDRIVRGESLLSVPRGGMELYRGVHIPGRPQYVRYLLPQYGEERSEE